MHWPVNQQGNRISINASTREKERGGGKREQKVGENEREEDPLRDLETLFAHVEDPRVERTKLHRLRDSIILAMCGVICGAEGWVEMEECAKAKEAFFTERLNVPNGIPSHDPFGRVFALIDPQQFETSFVQWVAGISKSVKGVVAVDGKTRGRSHDHAAGKKALHLVSAWAVENHLVLAQ